VDRECHDFCAALALGVESVKLIDRALEQISLSWCWTIIIGMSLSSTV
jgi:hypothetical protein